MHVVHTINRNVRILQKMHHHKIAIDLNAEIHLIRCAHLKLQFQFVIEMVQLCVWLVCTSCCLFNTTNVCFRVKNACNIRNCYPVIDVGQCLFLLFITENRFIYTENGFVFFFLTTMNDDANKLVLVWHKNKKPNPRNFCHEFVLWDPVNTIFALDYDFIWSNGIGSISFGNAFACRFRAIKLRFYYNSALFFICIIYCRLYEIVPV